MLGTALLVLFSGYCVFVAWSNRSGGAYASYRPALTRFFEHTGYRVHGLDDRPPEEQAQAVVADWAHGWPGTPKTPRPYTRDLDGDRLVYYHVPLTCPDRWDAPLGRSGWVLYLREPPRVEWSLQPRRTAVRWLRDRIYRYSPPRWPVAQPPAALGDPDLRARFEAGAADEALLDRLLATPGLVSALLALPELDLRVLSDRIVLLDPIRRNLTAAAGGFVQTLVAHDKERLFELQAMAHERVMDLLALVARASREVA